MEAWGIVLPESHCSLWWMPARDAAMVAASAEDRTTLLWDAFNTRGVKAGQGKNDDDVRASGSG